MKFSKYLFMMLAVLCFTACSDDDNDWNSAPGVTVSMASPSMSIRESQGICRVPIVVNGDANGPIQLAVKVLETGADPAMENVHYIVTTKTINIPEWTKATSIELNTVDDKEENEDRTFDVVIEKVLGAEIGSVSTTQVTIKDDDKDPYFKLLGGWIFTADNIFDGTSVVYNLTMRTPDLDDEDEAKLYGKELYAGGFGDMDAVFLTFSYKYNESTAQGSMGISLGQYMSWNTYNFGSFKGVFVSAGHDGTDYVHSGSIPCMWNEDFTEITFDDPEDIFIWGVRSYPEMEWKGSYDGFTNMKMVRAL